MKPGGAAAVPPLTLKSIAPPASTKRSRVSALITQRARSAPVSESSQRAG
jgi:hypothetical protein